MVRWAGVREAQKYVEHFPNNRVTFQVVSYTHIVKRLVLLSPDFCYGKKKGRCIKSKAEDTNQTCSAVHFVWRETIRGTGSNLGDYTARERVSSLFNCVFFLFLVVMISTVDSFGVSGFSFVSPRIQWKPSVDALFCTLSKADHFPGWKSFGAFLWSDTLITSWV